MKLLISGNEDYDLEIVIKNKQIRERYKDNPDKVRNFLLVAMADAITLLLFILDKLRFTDKD